MTGFYLANASPMEALFVLMALIGVACNFWCLLDVFADMRRAWKANGRIRNDDRAIIRITAIGNLRAELVRLIAQSFFLLIGVLSLALPPSERPDPVAMTERQRLIWTWIVWVRAGLLLSTCGLAINSIFDLRDRRAIANRLHAASSRRRSSMDERSIGEDSGIWPKL